MPARRFLLDGNIYNLLEPEPTVRNQVRALTENGRVEIVASPVVVTELQRSPFRGVPTWFRVIVQPEGIAISGLARSGMVRDNWNASPFRQVWVFDIGSRTISYSSACSKSTGRLTAHAPDSAAED